MTGFVDGVGRLTANPVVFSGDLQANRPGSRSVTRCAVSAIVSGRGVGSVLDALRGTVASGELHLLAFDAAYKEMLEGAQRQISATTPEAVVSEVLRRLVQESGVSGVRRMSGSVRDAGRERSTLIGSMPQSPQTPQVVGSEARVKNSMME